VTSREQLETRILEYAFGDEPGDHATLVHEVARSSDALGYVMELVETVTVLSRKPDPSSLQRLHVLLDDVMIAMGQAVSVPIGAG
jgi:hypothetical protein